MAILACFAEAFFCFANNKELFREHNLEVIGNANHQSVNT
jgi:hypothetical protein